MTTLIKDYITLREAIVGRAVNVINMLYSLDLPDHLDEYKPDWCGVEIDRMEVNCGITVQLTYYVPYESFEEQWTIPASYIDMDDELIKEDFIKRITEQFNRDKKRKIDLLKHDDKMLGYELLGVGE